MRNDRDGEYNMSKEKGNKMERKEERKTMEKKRN